MTDFPFSRQLQLAPIISNQATLQLIPLISGAFFPSCGQFLKKPKKKKGGQNLKIWFLVSQNISF